MARIIFMHGMGSIGEKLIENVEELQIGGTTELEFVDGIILERGDSGEEMKRWARNFGCNLGQLDAEYLLEHPEKIPAWPESVSWIPFPGTVWCGGDGLLYMPYIHRDDGRLSIPFHHFGYVWDSSGGLLRPRKPGG